jgi:hypothetical protein
MSYIILHTFLGPPPFWFRAMNRQAVIQFSGIWYWKCFELEGMPWFLKNYIR